MGMVQLHNTYKDQGFQIIGVPCNQFSHQEPNSNSVIEAFAATKSTYATAVCDTGLGCPFPMLAKSTVNGPMCNKVFDGTAAGGCTADSEECCTFNNPLYTYLRGQSDGQDISWNFNKFLVDKTGSVLTHYLSRTEPEDLSPDIEAAIAAPTPDNGH